MSRWGLDEWRADLARYERELAAARESGLHEEHPNVIKWKRRIRGSKAFIKWLEEGKGER